MIKAAPRIGYSLITAAVLGVGTLASALPAQGSAAGPHHVAAQARGAASARARFTKTLVGYLKGRGFQVNPGYPLLYPVGDVCAKYTYPTLHSCFGNNPAAPYVVAVVKAWPHEYAGPTPRNALGPLRPGYIPVYRLDPRDAIVFYGKLPPPGRYMSVQSFEWSQHGHWKAKDYSKWAHTPNRAWPMQYMFSTIPPNDPKAGRTFTFSSLGDAVNNMVMQRRSGDPWGKNRYFIITPSATTDHAVRRALQAQGVPDGAIFTEQIPSRDSYGPIGPLGMGKNAIDFNTWFRYAVPDNPAAADQWRKTLPLTVLRLRAPSSVGPVNRYGSATYGEQAGRSEAYLAGDLHNLLKGVCNRVTTTTGLHSADCTQPPPASSVIDWYSLTGPYCREINCWAGDNGNEATGVTARPLPLDSGQVYAVVSTLATETGNATYVALAVNDASTLFSPAKLVLLDTMLKGSADGYANTVSHPGKFYVHYYTRNCSVLEPMLGKSRLASDCTAITAKDVPPKADTSALGHPALRGKFILAIRDYIAPGTHKGPDPSKLLKTRILTFTKP